MMQLKRILVSFLVAVMLISLAIVAVSAADESASFGIAVDTANAEGNIKVTPGDKVDVDVKITNNPGVGSINFEVVYDATVLTLDGYTFNDKAYSLGELGAIFEVEDKNNDGLASVFVFTDPDAKENKNADVIITLHFTVAEDFEGTEAKVMINAENIEVFTPSGDKITNVETAASCSKGHTPAKAVVENEVAATCYAEGTYDEVVYCSVCEEEISREAKTTEKIEHTPAEAVKEKEVAAECEKEGSYDEVVYCAVEECKAELSREAKTVAALGHTAEFVAATAPTCTEEGKTAGMQCTVCKKFTVEQTEIAALGHTFGEYTSNDDATCTANATETAKCVRCDVTDTRTVADTKKPHNVKDAEATDPTCTKPGYIAAGVCADCGATVSAEGYVPALGHTAGEVVVENKVDATCTDKGSYDNVVYCTVCEEEISRKTVIVDKLAHNSDVVIEAVAAGCETIGLSAGAKCSVCGVITVEQEVIPATGHTAAEIAAVAATCTTAGSTAGSKCSVCEEILEAPKAVDPIAHNSDVAIDAVEAACESNGLTAGAKCSVCGIVTVAQEVVPATGHTATEIAAVAATCTKAGSTAGSKCSVCDEILEAPKAVDPIAHNSDVALDAVEAACESNGLTAGAKCSVCGIVTVAQEVVPATGHTATEIAAVAATCTTAGSTAGSKCSVCNEILEAPKPVDPADHTATAIAAVEATCTTAGSTAGTKCSVCNVVLTAPEVVQAKGHTEEVIPAVEATKKADGLTEGKKCTTCGEITDEQGVIPMLPTSLAWLWVLIAAVVVIGALVVVYFVVLRKKK